MARKTVFTSALLTFFFCTGSLLAFTFRCPAVPAFPGAEGPGMWSVGGRGGRVIEVTNLNDSGPGSLRAAVEAKGPRIVVFKLSGTIELKSTLRVTNPFITVAGQTAPGGGICLKNYRFEVAADHVIVRHMRFRPGDNAAENAGFRGPDVDSLSVTAGRNIIIDHCSASWSVDETLSVTEHPDRGPLDNVTIQWCIISESLNCSVHPKKCHGYGALIRGAWGANFAYHHNLFAHHFNRSPRPGNNRCIKDDPEGFVFDFRNNVVYNWGHKAAGYNSDGVTTKCHAITKMNFVGNYYIAGPNSRTPNRAFYEKCIYSKAYFHDNWMNGKLPEQQWDLLIFGKNLTPEQIELYKQTKPFKTAYISTDTAAVAYQKVIASAGATLPARDPVDTRVISHVKNAVAGKADLGKIIDDEDQVGSWPELKSTPPPQDSDHDGMPDKWEKKMGLNPKDRSDGSADLDADGYTNLEEYLNSIEPRYSVCGNQMP